MSNPRRSRPIRASLLGAAIGVLVVVVLFASGVTTRTSTTHVRSIDGCGSTTRTVSVLLVGNSYTSANDLGQMLAEVLCSGMSTGVHVDTLTEDGAKLSRWDSTATKHRIASHDVVVLQDQSEVPGFGDGPEFRGSINAIGDLSRAAAAAHTRVVLLETWAYKDGDPQNPVVYPDFQTMQDDLGDGYQSYLDSITGIAPDSTVASVGAAWSFLSVNRPEVFGSLYSADGRHPSITGTYLAALVLAETITKHSVRLRPWVPPTISQSQANAALAAAQSVLH